MPCLLEITKAGRSRPCKYLVPLSWAFPQQVLCYKTQPGLDVDGHTVTEVPGPPSFTSESCSQLPQKQVTWGLHDTVCTLIFLNKFFPVCKGINSQIPNTKLNSSSHRKFVSKDEFCSQINHWEYRMNPQDNFKNMNWIQRPGWICVPRDAHVGGKVRRSLCKRSRSKSSPLLTNLVA